LKVQLRRKIFLSQNKCKICGSTKKLHIDHIFPKSKGGTDVEGNLQVLCAICNIKKGNQFDFRRSQVRSVES
jgi:5-methylcytosine-specific restriction endonuclease McrA